MAEDLSQEALAEALTAWPRDGVPRSPAGWLLTVGWRRAIGAFRRRSALDERYAAFARDLDEGGATSGGLSESAGPDPDVLWDPDRIDDDVLALMFIACHPILSREASVALTLRLLGGLTSEEIARLFLVRTATAQARITRAKDPRGGAGAVRDAAQGRATYPALLGDQRAVPDLHRRVDGHVRHRADPRRPRPRGGPARPVPGATRPGRAGDARPARAPRAHLLPVPGTRSGRRRARAGGAQDRRRWDRSAIRRGRAALARAALVGRMALGAYGLQAAIAECHAVAPSVDETDWERVFLLYEALGRLAPSPIVELNKAVAISVAQGPAAALPVVDDLVVAGSLSSSHLLPSVHGELLTRLGRTDKARRELELAVRLCRNDRERDLLERKIAELA